MDIGYKRLSKSGPREAEQDAALIAAGVVMDLGLSLYVDLAPTKRRPASFQQRDNAVRCLRPGDRLVIHSAPRLGATEAEITAAVAAVTEYGAAVFDCSTQAEIRFHPDAGRLVAWAKAGALLAAQERLGKARQGITRRGAPPKKLTGDKLAQAKALWPNMDRSVAAIAEELDVAPRTLYRAVEDKLLPKRGDK